MTQYLKPETKEDPEAEAAILPPTNDVKDDVSKPKTEADLQLPAKDELEAGKNGAMLPQEAQATCEKQNGGPPVATCEAEAEEKRGGCGCCLWARTCVICKIFLMINWRLLLDCNFIIIAIGTVSTKPDLGPSV